MLEILKNMWRRKTRTILTVAGIAIGIFALIVMGSIAEKLNLLVSGGTDYYKDKVAISAKSNTFSLVPILLSKKSEVEKVDGVQAVFAQTYSTLKSDSSSVSFGPPASIESQQDGSEKYETFKIRISRGRELSASDSKKAVLGSDLVKKLNTDLGKKIKLRGSQYEVVGIYEKTFTTPDTSVFVPFADGQTIMYQDQPEIIKKSVSPSQIVYGFVVYPKKGVNPDDLAKKIEKEIPDVTAIGPKAFKDQVASTVGIFNSMIYGIALISLLVGTLSIVNTMTMSISERVREIGVKKAVGAKNRNIMIEYLTEAGIIGLLGGVIGLTLGWLLILAVNSSMEKIGDKIFLLTPRLAISAVIFSIIIGVIAGIYPAYHAVRLSIVKSLREE
jgi:putative ABC transport system permease protein